jgi:hypothetical protein
MGAPPKAVTAACNIHHFIVHAFIHSFMYLYIHLIEPEMNEVFPQA